MIQKRLIAVFAVSLATLCHAPAWGDENAATQERTTTKTIALTPAQQRAIALLRQNRPPEPAPLFLFTDPNKDPDDLSVLVVTKFLQQEGFVELRCVLTTLGDHQTRIRRAEFTRVVLDELELDKVKVGVGVDYGYEVFDASGTLDAKATAGRKLDHQVFIETPLLRSGVPVQADGLELLQSELSKVPDGSAVLLINSGMADPARLFREAPELVKQKTAKVVIMGGVQPEVDKRGFVIADSRAYNNTTHQASATDVYARAQELGLPLVVVSKEAAYAAAAPRSFYEGMAATRHPVGVYLRDQQRNSLKHLWDGIQQGRLPAALTTEWFFRTFTDVDINSADGKAAMERAKTQAEDFSGVWQQVSKFNLYDPLALLAAAPGAGKLLFKADVPAGVVGNVHVVGKDSINDPSLTKDLLAAMAISSLNPPEPRKSRTGTAPGYPPRQHVGEQDAPWTKPLPGYDPPDYTAEKVFHAAWADPPDVNDVTHPFLTSTPAGEVAVTLNQQGQPLNPLGRTGLRGRGLLGKWGRNRAGDPLLTRVHPETGRLQLLVIQRKDSGEMALPGGMVDEGEDIASTVARELHEETGATVDFKQATVIYTGVVDDPRNTDNAWMETTVLHKHLSSEEQSTMKLQAGDDATDVAWVDLDKKLLSSMYASHGQYVRLALQNLRDVPEISQQVSELLK